MARRPAAQPAAQPAAGSNEAARWRDRVAVRLLGDQESVRGKLEVPPDSKEAPRLHGDRTPKPGSQAVDVKRAKPPYPIAKCARDTTFVAWHRSDRRLAQGRRAELTLPQAHPSSNLDQANPCPRRATAAKSGLAESGQVRPGPPGLGQARPGRAML